ncbi:hypothetical protein TU94_12990 [Streptomyces cyaneogriseus subsp. noncyanogenus]|uniref:Uncharacterized protein n=1 Tax=Streptomyces cyaneogriseus subsp. noncyanogenus TaxID=477245 RepID=A0A0C5G154_9ACTN|nr:hypothetical protein [Streptomyces cyaneogriseus]AJP02260.1 hypothetical protein TU94_12990 [Streptomyces cyaneogriseus subsp. noncyanogenus]
MPRFRVTAPAYRVQAYPHTCPGPVPARPWSGPEFRERLRRYGDGHAAAHATECAVARAVRRAVPGESGPPPPVPPGERRPAPGATAARAARATVEQPAGPRTVTESL